MAGKDNPINVRSLGRTLRRWKDEICAWLAAGPLSALMVQRVNSCRAVRMCGWLRIAEYRLLVGTGQSWSGASHRTPRGGRVRVAE